MARPPDGITAERSSELEASEQPKVQAHGEHDPDHDEEEGTHHTPPAVHQST